MMNNQLATGGSPQVGGFLSPAPVGGSVMATIASNAATAEVLTSLFVAKQFPRNMVDVVGRIQEACARPALAEVATYAYPRGGQMVEGASIRLAEVLLSSYGNAEAGWQEIARRFDPKGAEGKGCEVATLRSFCFDKETNTRREITFDVPLARFTKKGANVLTDSRDVYELCANMASRRIRACILQVIPSYLTDEALAKCQETLRKGDGQKPLADRVRDMEVRFKSLGVSREMLEAKLEHSLAECIAPEVLQMGKVYNSIKEGYTRVKDVFMMPAPAAQVVEPELAGGEIVPPPAEARRAKTPKHEPAPEFTESSTTKGVDDETETWQGDDLGLGDVEQDELSNFGELYEH